MLRKKTTEQKINSTGFSLIEVMVAVLILAILTLGVYSLITLSVQISSENQHYVEAIEIANQRMEEIRNMPYDDVGTINNPSAPGNLPQTETVTRQGTYTVDNWVAFYDDPFDGTAASSTDTIPNDYKIATIKVSWIGRFGPKNVTIFSKIIPKTMETFKGYGLLAVTVTNANGVAVPSDAVNPTNIEVIHVASGTSATYPADDTGHLYLPVPAAYQGYQVIVTKNGYSSDQTYALGDSYNPNPLAQYLNVTVNQGAKGDCALTIDKLATLNISTVSASNLPVNWQVNQIRSGEMKNHIGLGSDANNNLYITWQSYNTTSSSIFVQKYDSTQTKQWASDKKIYNTSFQRNPSIVVTNDGHSLVVWQDNSLSLKQQLAFNDTYTAPSHTHLAFSTDNNLNNQAAAAHANQPDLFSQWKEKIISAFSGFKNELAYLGNVIAGRTFMLYRLAMNLFPSENNIYKLNNLDISNSEAASLISSVGTATGNIKSNGKSFSVSVPSGVAVNDLLIVFLYMNSTSDTFNSPSGTGWQTATTTLQPSGGSAGLGAIFYKFVASGDPSSYTLSVTGSNTYLAANMRAFHNADYLSASPFSGSLLATTTASGNTTRVAPSQTVTKDGSMLVCGWGAADQHLGSGVVSWPSGMSNTRADNTSNVSADSAEQSVGSGTTGNKTLTINSSNDSFKSINWSLIINPLDFLTVDKTGSQKTSLIIASSSQYVGGAFVITATSSAHTITSIKIHLNDSASSTSDITNVKLYYDLDATAPYDCASETYTGTESQFGATTNLSSSTNSATFTGSVSISTTQTMCVYVVADVPSSATRYNTVNFSIQNPATDVAVTGTQIYPASAVALNGSSNLLKQAEMQQVHYRWRNDDSSETGATWNADEDASASTVQNNNIRLRIEVSNDGDATSSGVTYLLQYGLKQTACSAITSWTTIPTDNSSDWEITDSSNLTNNATTTDSSGLTDENTNFVPGYTKDTNNQTPAITLSSIQLTEIEYSLQATTNATSSANYCFRLTNAGSTSGFSYTSYPEAAVIGNNNIYIESLKSDGTVEWTKKVNAINDNTEHIYPVIAYTENSGTATSVIAWEDYRNGNSDIYLQSFDHNGNRLWGSDKAVAATTYNEYMASIMIDADNIVYIAWVANEASGEIIHLQKFDLDGNSIGSEMTITSSATNEYSPVLSRGETSNYFYLAWTEDNGSGTDKNVKIAKFDSSGSLAWSQAQPANISSASYDQSEPGLAFGNNYAYVSWTDKREGNEDIYTQKFDTSGSSQWSSDQRINISTDSFDQNDSAIIVDSAGQALGVWSDQRNGSSSSDVYATEFGDPGTASAVANIPLTVKGTKIISALGYPIVLKYNKTQTTNSSGNLTLGLEFDTYNIDTFSASTSLTVSLSSLTQPITLNPSDSKTLLLYVK